MRLGKRMAALEQVAIQRMRTAIGTEIAAMSPEEKAHWRKLSDSGQLEALEPLLRTMLRKHGVLQSFEILKDRYAAL